MSGVSDYADRVRYFRARYAARRSEYCSNGRAYRRRNRSAIKVARSLGVSVGEARSMLKATGSAA